MNIVKATVRIDIEDYAQGIKDNPGFIDGSPCFREPSEERVVDTFESLEDAESKIDRTVYLEITETEAILEFEYITGSEDLYFNSVEFMGSTYPMDSDMSSEECYAEILKNL